MTLRFLLTASLLTAGRCAMAGEGPPRILDQVLECNARATGAQELTRLHTVSYRLEIEEPGFTVEGHYRAARDGRMRIDIHADGEVVFAEGLDDGQAWLWQQGDDEANAGSEKGAAALRHGIEQPGHFYVLGHMETNGHDLALAGTDTIDGATHDVVALTLADGFRQWYWVDRETCLVARNRTFRAFHPDMDPAETWVETRYSDFRTVGGVTRAYLSENVDLATGRVLGRTRVLEYVPNPDLGPGSLAPP